MILVCFLWSFGGTGFAGIFSYYQLSCQQDVQVCALMGALADFQTKNTVPLTDLLPPDETVSILPDLYPCIEEDGLEAIIELFVQQILDKLSGTSRTEMFETILNRQWISFVYAFRHIFAGCCSSDCPVWRQKFFEKSQQSSRCDTEKTLTLSIDKHQFASLNLKQAIEPFFEPSSFAVDIEITVK